MTDQTQMTDPLEAESAAAYELASEAWEAVKFTPDSPTRRDVWAKFNRAWLARADFCDARNAARKMAKAGVAEVAAPESVLVPAPVDAIVVERMPVAEERVHGVVNVVERDGQMGLFG